MYVHFGVKKLSGIFDELKFPSEIFGCDDKQSAILVVGGFPNICVDLLSPFSKLKI